MRIRNENPATSNNNVTPIQLHDLQPGDILVFRPSKQVWAVQQVIMLVQALLQKEHGHYDTTHVSICIGKNEDNKPVIAHVTENKMGFVVELLEEMFKLDDGDRPFLVFRHQNPASAKQIADIAGHEDNHNKGLRWELKTGITSLITNKKIDPGTEMNAMISLSTSTICSQFVIEILKIIAKQNGDVTTFPDIHSTSTPKVLEAYLYESTHFDKLCYLGQDAFISLQGVIERELNRLASQDDRKSRAKYSFAYVNYHSMLEKIKKIDKLHEMDKCLALIKAVLPIFEHNTGTGLATNTTSAASLLGFARKMGLFHREINRFSIDDIGKPEDIGEAVQSFDI